MSHQAAQAEHSLKHDFDPSPVNVRVKLAGLWTTTLFIFAYVDIFSFFRPDVRADIEAGQISSFEIGEAFLLGTTVYILLPSLMVFGSLVLKPRVARLSNVILAVVYALTIAAGAIGEWAYYVLGSAVEVVLLAGITYYAWTWPKMDRTSGATAGTTVDVAEVDGG